MWLAIETSSPQASLALFEPASREAVWSDHFFTDRSHNSRIFGPVSEALEISGRSLDRILVGTGPGSYSGIRVGISVANGLEIALGAQIAGISSFAAIEPNLSDYLVAGDARRQTFYIARVTDGKLDDEPVLMDGAEFAYRLKETGELPIFTMDESIAKNYPGIEPRFPDAIHFARQFEHFSEIHDGHPIEPHYLRPPYITQAKKKPVPGFPSR